MKYTLEFKLECVDKYKKGIHIDTTGKTKSQRGNFMHHVKAWVQNYDDLGIDGLKHSNKNKEWTAQERFALVVQVLAGNSLSMTAKKAHIDSGLLYQWVKRYREKGLKGLELRKGRKPKMQTIPKKRGDKLTFFEREELIFLRARNAYLESENDYIKKLDALVTKREAAHPKAKKQKLSNN